MSKADKKPLQLYLTAEQKKKLKRMAAKEGLTMTGFIADIIRNEKLPETNSN